MKGGKRGWRDIKRGRAKKKKKKSNVFHVTASELEGRQDKKQTEGKERSFRRLSSN